MKYTKRLRGASGWVFLFEGVLYVMSNTGTRLQLSEGLTLLNYPQQICDLYGVCDLILQAGNHITNNACPSFVTMLEPDTILQMIYDNGNLTLDFDKGCGAFFEIHTILDEIRDWFADADGLANALHSDSHSELASNIIADGLALPEVQSLMDSILHYIPSEEDAVGLPLCLIDCLYSGESHDHDPDFGRCKKCGDYVTFPCCNCIARELGE